MHWYFLTNDGKQALWPLRMIHERSYEKTGRNYLAKIRIDDHEVEMTFYESIIFNGLNEAQNPLICASFKESFKVLMIFFYL